MKAKQIIQLTICIAIPLVIGSLEGFFTIEGVRTWYATQNKPSFNPPNWLFAPAWTLLYILMGISLYWIWSSPKTEQRTQALYIFSIQLFLNFAWSFLFFTLHNPLLALIDIVLLIFAIIAMIVTFKKIKPVAGYLQIPYLCWVSFATLLNASIWWLNK